MTIHSSSVLNADFGSKIPMSVWKTGVVRLPSQTMHHLEKKPSKLPCICIKFDSHPKTTGNLFMIETNFTSPMGFSWNFHWKHFTCLFRMKSYQWQKVTTSFKIVAETLKLVPFQKNNHFQGLKFQKKKPSITKKLSSNYQQLLQGSSLLECFTSSCVCRKL